MYLMYLIPMWTRWPLHIKDTVSLFSAPSSISILLLILLLLLSTQQQATSHPLTHLTHLTHPDKRPRGSMSSLAYFY